MLRQESVVSAHLHIRKMRGGAQSHLMMASDNKAYVVKFQNNPQGSRILANEYLATKLAQKIGLPVPNVKIVDVSQWLVSNTAELVVSADTGPEPCSFGYQFGSQFVGGLFPGRSFDYLPEPLLREVRNKVDFAGMLLFDKWTANSDGRQAVFTPNASDRTYSAVFIDQGNCFNAERWDFQIGPLSGVYARNAVYSDITGWHDFECWLDRLMKIDDQTIWEFAARIPQEWLGGKKSGLEKLVDQLAARKERVCELVEQFRDSSREPFPSWGGCSKKVKAQRQPGVLYFASSRGSM